MFDLGRPKFYTHTKNIENRYLLKSFSSQTFIFQLCIGWLYIYIYLHLLDNISFTCIIVDDLLQNVGIYSMLMACLYRATPTGPRIKQSQLNHRPNNVAFYMYYKQEVLGIYSKPVSPRNFSSFIR